MCWCFLKNVFSWWTFTYTYALAVDKEELFYIVNGGLSYVFNGGNISRRDGDLFMWSSDNWSDKVIRVIKDL